MKSRLANAGRALVIPALLALSLVTPATVAAGDPCYHGYVMPPATSGTDTQIKLLPCSFAPTVTFVEPGAEVTFFNGPDYTHLITGANQVWGSRDVEVLPNGTVSYTFEEEGVYPYACALHVGMSGAIVVGDVASGLGAGTGGVTGGPTDVEVAASVAPAPDPETAARIAAAEAAAADAVTQGSVSQPASTTGAPVEFVALAIGALLLGGGIALGLAFRRRGIARPFVRAD
jgi:plastocyanin